eukprot:scaffold10002_cov58-Phaeocystis_antarctica.AAC.2
MVWAGARAHARPSAVKVTKVCRWTRAAAPWLDSAVSAHEIVQRWGAPSRRSTCDRRACLAAWFGTGVAAGQRADQSAAAVLTNWSPPRMGRLTAPHAEGQPHERLARRSGTTRRRPSPAGIS